MGQKIDFHIHTWFSDGSIAPAEIVRQAKEKGYDKIAITDHDGIDGIEEAQEAGKKLGLEIVPGIELATETEDGTGLHILGYHIDTGNQRLLDVLEDLRRKRDARNAKLLQELEDMGYPLSEDDLMLRPGQNFIGKPIIARAMVAKGYVKKPKDAFAEGEFLESPRAKKIKKEKMKTVDAIRLIKEAGGIAVLAHPIQIRGFGVPGSEEFYQKVDELAAELQKEGLGGMECYHCDHNREQAQRFSEIAEKHGLQITRGSDFHGTQFE